MSNPFIYSSNVRHNRSCDLSFFVKHWETIADNLSKAGGVGAASQRWISKGAQSGSQTHIATTESGS
jgi:hypothetical protein